MFVFILKESHALWEKNPRELFDEEISTAKLRNTKEYCISNNLFSNPFLQLKCPVIKQFPVILIINCIEECFTNQVILAVRPAFSLFK